MSLHPSTFFSLCPICIVLLHQINSWYIQGTVQKNSEGQYWLHCPQKDSQVILPEQILKLRNGLLTVQIAGAELIFTKNSEAAVTLNDVTYR